MTPPLPPDEVIAADALDRRPSRPPDHWAESHALRSLAATLATRPEDVLQHLVELALPLTRADAVGISLLEPGGEDGVFRWAALAGTWAPFRNGTMPRAASPCGEVIARDAVLLMTRPDRAFPALLQADPGIAEGLLAPFHVGGKPVGTVWAVKHDPGDGFEQEDARLLRSLSDFASAGYRMRAALDGARARDRDGEERYRRLLEVERARGEQALRESEIRYRTLFQTMGQGYCLNEIVRDADGKPVDFRHIELNPAWERLTGLTVAEARGRTTTELFGAVEEARLRAADQVVRTGEPLRLEHTIPAIGRTYEATYYPADGDRFSVTYEDITGKKRAEAALRESEERKGFLLGLGDGMRAQATASGKIEVAARLLGERLKASRILYAEYDWDEGLAHVFNGWFADGAQPFPAVMHLEGYDGQVLRDLRAGRTVRVDDVGLLADEPAFAAIAALGVQALLSPPLIVDGTLVMNLSVHQHAPRQWTDDEVALVQEVADRLWPEVERARAEAALRGSEERFAQFAKASSAGLWVRDAATHAMEYVSPAIGAIYGTAPDAILGPLERWAALIVPEDRDTALAHIEDARRGEAVVHEFRIQRPSDRSFRWIRDTAFPLDDDGGVRRIGGIAEDVTEARLNAEHQTVLLAELQHRVRNIMAILRSVAARTGERAASVPEYASLLAGRLMTLARVQALLTRGANVGVALRTVLADELAAGAAASAAS